MEMKMNYKDIARAHELKSVKVSGNKVVVNQGEDVYAYNSARIAKAVAKKLKYLYNIK